jgi:uncharacterized coiled-coil DUF342 family protein
MPSQELFNILVMAVGGLGGWVLKAVWEAIRDLNNDVKELGHEVRVGYVRRDDFLDAIDRIETMVSRIFDKLDDKADKR